MRIALIGVLGVLLVAGSSCKKREGSYATIAEAYAVAIDPNAKCTRIDDGDEGFAVCRMDGAVWKCTSEPVQCMKLKDITAERPCPAPLSLPLAMPLFIDGGVP